MKIGLTSVFVRDVDEAFTFYTEVLGFREKLRVPAADLAIVVSPEDEDGAALLLEPNQHPAAGSYQRAVYDEGLPVIVFATADLQGDYERLRARGVRFRQEPTRTEAGLQAVFDDTCGNFIMLFQG